MKVRPTKETQTTMTDEQNKENKEPEQKETTSPPGGKRKKPVRAAVNRLLRAIGSKEEQTDSLPQDTPPPKSGHKATEKKTDALLPEPQ